jgi:hypothetical protein
MVGSQFVLINRNGRRTLVNISQIASLWVDDIDMSKGTETIFYRDIDPAAGTVYTIELLMTSRREVYFYFPNATERDAVYEQLLAAISPALVIESNGASVPMLSGQKWSRFPKPKFPNEAFATEQDYDRAAIDAMTSLMVPRTPPTAAPPTSKPPRKPQTPRE